MSRVPLRQFLRQGVAESLSIEQSWALLAKTLEPLPKLKTVPSVKLI